VDQADNIWVRRAAGADRRDGLYLHMHVLVELHGQPGWVAALTPLSVDGMIVAASTTSLSRGLGDIRLHELPGLLEGVLGVADGDPLLFGAQIFSVGELESGERVGFRQGQRRVGLVIPVEVFLEAQRSVGLNVA
jgi:hypothetical protein